MVSCDIYIIFVASASIELRQICDTARAAIRESACLSWSRGSYVWKTSYPVTQMIRSDFIVELLSRTSKEEENTKQINPNRIQQES